MARNKRKEHSTAEPVEKHDTAAWANVKKTKPVSNVTMPGEIQAGNAKEWVDTNAK